MQKRAKRERIEKKTKARLVGSGVSLALFVLVERHLEPGELKIIALHNRNFVYSHEKAI